METTLVGGRDVHSFVASKRVSLTGIILLSRFLLSSMLYAPSPFSSPFPSLLPFFFFFSLLSPSVRFEDASRNAPHHRTNVPEKFPGLSLIFHAAARCSDIDFLAIFVQPPPCGPYSKFRMKSDGKRSWTISVNCFSTGQTESRNSLPGRPSIMLSASERIARISTINYLSPPDYPYPRSPRFATDRLSGPATIPRLFPKEGWYRESDRDRVFPQRFRVKKKRKKEHRVLLFLFFFFLSFLLFLLAVDWGACDAVSPPFSFSLSLFLILVYAIYVVRKRISYGINP